MVCLEKCSEICGDILGKRNGNSIKFTLNKESVAVSVSSNNDGRMLWGDGNLTPYEGFINMISNHAAISDESLLLPYRKLFRAYAAIRPYFSEKGENITELEVTSGDELETIEAYSFSENQKEIFFN